MSLYTPTIVTNNKRYRVTNRAKFILSTSIMFITFITIAYVAFSFIISEINEYRQEKAYEAWQQELEILKKKYSFTIGEIEISATSADEALTKLKAQTEAILIEKNSLIDEQQQIISGLEEKYVKDIYEMKQVTKEEVKLYNQYAYALEYPESDMTIDDLKMIKEITDEENINMHLWLSVVEVESGYRSYVRSSLSTAAGWGQVLKGTGEFLYEDSLKLGKYNHQKMGTDKEINARMSIHYLAMLIKEKGSIEKALISYNGNELGQRYVTLVNNTLKKNTGMTLNDISIAN